LKKEEETKKLISLEIQRQIYITCQNLFATTKLLENYDLVA